MEQRGEKLKQANAVTRYEITEDDLPLHCPMPGMALWNSHPRVFLDVKAEGHAQCPYCSAEYILK
ncbi:MAG: zinc-finger domain-containing protein [Chromatiales bacterium]|nr:zinc-finger domain-containing protein [Chromatiales bacterium]